MRLVQSAAIVRSMLFRLAASLLVAWLPFSSAIGQVFGTAYTDLWWNPSESGWGVTVDHQQDVMFLTFFVYRADNSPYWVTATLLRVGSNSLGSPPHQFTGDVYETNGPAFSATFNPAAVTERTVGTATFTASKFNTATLQSIGGVTVSKAIQRQTLRFIDFSGIYNGGTSYRLSDCANPANNNQDVNLLGLITIAQSNASLLVTAQTTAGTCIFNGTYSQAGSIGAARGSFNCSDGSAGPFALDGMQWTIFGMSAQLSGGSQFCSFDGVVGGITVR